VRKLILLGFFYFILAIIWIATEYKEPRKESPPKITRRSLPKEKPYVFPADYIESHRKLAILFGNATNMFIDGNTPVLALPSFAMTTDNFSTVLLAYITESAYAYLYTDRRVRVVRRDYTSDSRSRIKAKYILIGRVGTIGNQIRITVRIQDINTGEILDAFDDYIDRTKVSKYL